MGKEIERWFMVCETCKASCACGCKYPSRPNMLPALYWGLACDMETLSDFLGEHSGQTHVLSFLPLEDAALACPGSRFEVDTHVATPR